MLIRALLICMVISSSCSEEKMTICFSGDLLLDRGVRAEIERRGVDTLFYSVASVFKNADYAIANLECPATEINAPVFKKYIFRADPEGLEAVRRSGITHLVMANNHSVDQGRDGLISTAANILKYGMVPVGYGKTYVDACSPVLIQKGKNKVAVFSSVPMALENWMPLPDKPSICQLTPEEVAENIKYFKKASPDYNVIVILHWGVEFRNEPEVIQRKQARMMIDAGADGIIGHHPHVVQSMEIYKGKPIFYSIGNFVFDQSKKEAKTGVIAELSFSKSQLSETKLIPFMIQKCTPVVMNNMEIEDFKNYLNSVSRSVIFEKKAGSLVIIANE